MRWDLNWSGQHCCTAFWLIVHRSQIVHRSDPYFRGRYNSDRYVWSARSKWYFCSVGTVRSVSHSSCQRVCRLWHLQSCTSCTKYRILLECEFFCFFRRRYMCTAWASTSSGRSLENDTSPRNERKKTFFLLLFCLFWTSRGKTTCMAKSNGAEGVSYTTNDTRAASCREYFRRTAARPHGDWVQ